MSDIRQRIANLSPEQQAYLRSRLSQEEIADKRTIPRREVSDRSPLSFAQQRLWFLQQLDPDDTSYNISRALRLRGALDLEALRRALEEVVSRHEALRTRFEVVDGNPVQVISPTLDAGLPIEDLSGLPEAEREEAALRLAREEARGPFDLGRGPLFRARLLRLGQQEHVLLLAMHHIVSDGWSMGVLWRELGTLYEAFHRGEGSPLAEPPIQYADYALWQRGWLTGEVLEGQLGYWRRQLTDLAPLELPTDRPRPPVQTHRGASQSLVLPHPLLEELKQLARREGATLFMVLLAAFQVLLSRHSGQEDVAVGTPIAGRNRAETEDLIGFFLNTLVMRADLSGDPSFRELLGRVRGTALGAYEHQDVPFEKLVEELKPERDLSRTPLFQVFFNMLNVGGSAIELSELKAERIRSSNTESGFGSTSKFDITLYVAQRSESLHLTLVYNADLFEQDTVEQMLSHFGTLLEGIVADPERRLSSLSLLGEAERHELPGRGANGSGGPRPANPFVGWTQEDVEQSIPERFEGQVRKHPHKTAVRTRDHEWTYAQLDAAADRVAGALLARRGEGPEEEPERIALLFGHGAPMIAALLGVLKSGKAYVPLDASYPRERLAHVLRDAGACAIVTDGANLALAASLTEGELPLINVDDLDAAINSESPARVADAQDVLAGNVNLPASPDSVAYVLYTSGSTGQPKGVVQNHRNVLHFIRAYTNNLHVCPEDRLTLLSSYTFDAAVMDIFGALLNGASLHPIDLKAEGISALAGRLVERGITVYHSTPTVYRHFVGSLGEPGGPGGAREGFPGLRLVVLGGEAVERKDAELYKEHFPEGCLFVNGLGPTESTVSLQHFMDHGTPLRRHGVPVGRAVEGTEVLLLDGAGNEAEVYGEIAIRSPHVALGYWQKPELSREVFVPDPAGGDGRLYRTGDMGRLLPGGDIEWRGRKDHQVKVRGHRVELGEIEAVLNGHPGVREGAVAVLRGEEPGDERLVAYAVPRPRRAFAAGELRGHLKERLPEYMVPSAFVVLDALPLTPNGKVDRRALPAPDPLASRDEGEFVAPRDALEEQLAGIWSEVLGVERVGAHDDFFELGGHSLLATRVISRAREVFGVELALVVLFEAPTVAGLAEEIRAARRGGQGPPAPPLVPAPRGARSPLSFAQQRLWFLHQLDPDDTSYNISRAIRMRGVLDAGALERSLQEIVRRHEALRTTFAAVDGAPIQMISPTMEVGLAVEDLGGLPEAEREEAALRLAREEARRPFDLGRGPLFRARLLRLGEGEHALLLTMHHIVSDGWSMGVLRRELGALYGAFSEGKAPRLPEPPIQYADYALWQRGWLSGDVLEEQLSYWRRQLGELSALELPTDRPRPPVQTHRGGGQELVLSEEVSAGLKELGRREGATLFMVLLAAFQLLLSRYSGQEDVAVGTPIAGRNRAETEGLIGFFVNTLVMRCDLSGDPSFRELLGQVRETALRAFDHQDVPFEKLVEELRPERDLSRMPLAQVMFALQNMPRHALELPGLTFERQRVGGGTVKFDLTFLMHEEAEGLKGRLAYNADLFDEATVGRMVGHFRTLLGGIVADPDRPVSELGLLTEEERHRLLVEWNDTRTEYPRDRCVHELFEEQAERTPEAVAVVFGEERLSYRELDRRANRLAHTLRELGVDANTFVGVCLERSPAMIVALLGALKAGGAYVPLDPSYPAARLQFMIDDAAAAVILTQEATRHVLPAHTTSVLCLDADRAKIEQAATQNLVSGATAESLAYVIYTSGSTGQPKGVCVPHRAVNRLVIDTDYAQFTDQDVVAQASNATFDAATWEIWGALLNGARLVVLPKETVLSPPELAAQLEEQGISALFLTTALFNQVARENPAAFRPLRHLLFGGEAVKPKWVREVLAKGAPERLLHVYGPTETTTYATWHRVRAVEDGATTIPIGRPIANTEAYVLDARMQPAPIGVPGELYIGGPGVARGYLNRPELTEDKFVTHPFGEEHGARLYRTGDRVRRRADGDIEFLGRLDGQVKLRGFRVEPSEVEGTLNSHPAVRESFVLLREDAPEQKRLVAYVVPTGAAPLPGDLRAFLREKIPEYMVPSAFVALEALPLNPSGKIDRHALPPAPVATSSGDHAAPRDQLEEHLVLLWAQALDVPNIGLDDDFFDLGGHSLLAVDLFAEIEKAFGRRLPLAALFRAPTVRQLAEILRRDSDETLWSPLVAIKPRGSRPPFFCVHGARGGVLIFHPLAQHLGPDQPFYALQGEREQWDKQAVSNVEDIAAFYIRELRKLQPEGPYFIGGYSSGGAAAFEMARQLCAQDQEVALLAMIDAAHPSRVKRPFLRRMRNRVARLRHLGPLHYFWQATGKAFRRSAVWLSLSLGFSPPRIVRSASVAAVNRQVTARYVPQPYPGRIVFFSSAGRRRGPTSSVSAWESVATGGLEVRQVSGKHRSLLKEPHVRALAAELGDCLEQTQARLQ